MTFDEMLCVSAAAARLRGSAGGFRQYSLPRIADSHERSALLLLLSHVDAEAEALQALVDADEKRRYGE